MECIIRETTEIKLHPDNAKSEEGFSLSKSLKPLLQTLKEQKKSPFFEEKWLTLDFDHPRTSPFQGQLTPPPLHSVLPAAAHAVSTLLLTATQLISHGWTSHQYFGTCNAWWKPLALYPHTSITGCLTTHFPLPTG
jgi:hypothetical protein